MRQTPDITIKQFRLLKVYCRVLLVFLGLVLIQGGTALFGQSYPRQYLEQALENNPGLRAGYLSYEAAAQQPDIAAGLPAPEINAGIYTPPMERLMGRQLFDVSLMQMFPWFGTLGVQKSAAGKMADASYEQYRNQRNSLFLEVTEEWLNIYETVEQMQMVSRFIEILEAREDLIYSRYRGGVQSGGTALDIYRLELQLNELENRYNGLEEKYRAQIRSFNIRLNRPPDTPVEIPDTLLALEGVVDHGFPDSTLFDANPMVASSRAKAQAAAYEQEMARLMTRPMLGIGVQYSHFAPGDPAMMQMDGGAMVMPMFSITLPIYGKSNRAMRSQGEIAARRALLQEQQQVNDLATLWSRAAASQNNLNRDQEFLGRQLQVNQRAWELVLSAYAGGQEGFEQLLQIQDQLLEIEWRLLNTIVQQHQFAARLDMLLAREVFE